MKSSSTLTAVGVLCLVFGVSTLAHAQKKANLEDYSSRNATE